MFSNNMTKFIQQIRKRRNLTQEYLASELGVSRVQLIFKSNGAGGTLRNTEATAWRPYFGISLEELLQSRDTSMTATISKKKPKVTNENQQVRISVPAKKP